jgi:hypothetical protein
LEDKTAGLPKDEAFGMPGFFIKMIIPGAAGTQIESNKKEV